MIKQTLFLKHYNLKRTDKNILLLTDTKKINSNIDQSKNVNNIVLHYSHILEIEEELPV